MRALVVDDAVVVRRLVSSVLDEDPDIEVVGTAANGRIAIEKLRQLQPDVVTLDIEMPEMDGLETLRVIRELMPRLPVVMFSTQTQRGAEATLDALAAGASDYVTKPGGVRNLDEGRARVRSDLIPKIKALCVERRDTVTAAPSLLPPTRQRIAAPSVVVVIGVSTGGPNALLEVLRRLPATLAVPVIVVQHMPPLFTTLLAERLDGRTRLTVREITHGVVATPGTVWVAPGDYHVSCLAVRDQVVLQLDQGPPVHSCRPAVDRLFESAAQVFREGTLGVVLTGMGVDGTCGAQAIHAVGGQILVQDESTSVVWGMPGNVVRSGVADLVVPIERVADEILARVSTTRSVAAVS